MTDPDLYEAAEKFVAWLDRRLTAAGRGDRSQVLSVQPSGKFWLGRLTPEADVGLNLRDRNERLEPCACGLRVRTAKAGDWNFKVHVHMVVWLYSRSDSRWHKSEPITVGVPILLSAEQQEGVFGTAAIATALAAATESEHFRAEVRIERTLVAEDHIDWDVILVNTSMDHDRDVRDTNLYECELTIVGLPTEPFLLESLPDSFRYDRRVPSYGINCGVHSPSSDALCTVDVPSIRRRRPLYWNAPVAMPDLTFTSLAQDPISSSRALASALRSWGEAAWGDDSLDARARENAWTESMREEAADAAAQFEVECRRVEGGIELLERDERVRRAFMLMNRSMAGASRHKSWRAFQLGFLLANLRAVLAESEDARIADIVWFATGGGKTETYLGMILTTAFFDRLTGKTTGITAWSRFPLRMLSLQQTQRFADALAAGELVRREENIAGDPFSLGFFVGSGATPNKIPEEPKPDEIDCDDDIAIQKYRVLLRCPFCRSEDVRMLFDRRFWRLSHSCGNKQCSWGGHALPFYIVDDEIYRHLPTVVVGTLDKAASIALQASMRGFVGPPHGLCSESGHGYVYAARSKRPNGCLVPGCRGSARPLPMDARRFGPTFRLQDELHLLKDSLGAVDSHYEALYDELQTELGGVQPKILASSATLEGYARQVDVLYRRTARVFPLPGPSTSEGFWSAESSQLMRLYTAIAPRGVTIEYAVDRLLTELQATVRSLISDPVAICREIGIDPRFAPDLISLYGTNIVYGNTIRDLDAVMRSSETQVQVHGSVNTATLTGRTEFEEVRGTLHRLEHPEDEFDGRIHVITASSMMSHGVDIDRLNVMVMLGLPLTTSEFIQATSRVGRTWPGLVVVVHKIARERDAGVYRCFTQFVSQGDRLIEPIPITRRSRRVLEKTIAGLELARILMVHEPRHGRPLTTLSNLRKFLVERGFDPKADATAIERMLALASERDARLMIDIRDWFELLERNIQNSPPGAMFPSDASPSGPPMRSLRDVEEQVPIYERHTR